jgi:hypothetical protein
MIFFSVGNSGRLIKPIEEGFGGDAGTTLVAAAVVARAAAAVDAAARAIRRDASDGSGKGSFTPARTDA